MAARRSFARLSRASNIIALPARHSARNTLPTDGASIPRWRALQQHLSQIRALTSSSPPRQDQLPIRTYRAHISNPSLRLLQCRHNSSTSTPPSPQPGNSTPLAPPDHASAEESRVFHLLADSPQLAPVYLSVRDISGGCGSMYAIDIVAEAFRNLPIIRQHRLVNKVLGEEIKKWHGVQMKTMLPEEWQGN